jgi:hypothetical protein
MAAAYLPVDETGVWKVKNPGATTFSRKVAGRRRARIGVLVLTVLGSGVLLTTGNIGPSLRTEASAYEPGDLVDLQLRNGPLPAGYNLCFAFMTLQVHEAEGWETLAANLGPPEELVACTGELRPLPPLGGAQATVHLPSDLPHGDYRVVHALEVRGDRRAVATNAFTVGAGG